MKKDAPIELPVRGISAAEAYIVRYAQKSRKHSIDLERQTSMKLHRHGTFRILDTVMRCVFIIVGDKFGFRTV